MTVGLLLTIRPARAEDRDILFEWANDPATRQNSFSTEPIGWEEHCAWFSRALKNPDLLFLIGTSARTSIGLVRFNRRGAQALVSIVVNPKQRGQGLGYLLLKNALEYAAKKRDFSQVFRAEIKSANSQSIKIFTNCGFAVKERLTDKVLLELQVAMHGLLLGTNIK